MLDKHIMELVLEQATATGGDYGELYVEDTASNSITMQEGAIRSALSGRDFGASIRVFRGLDCFYGYTTNVTKEGLLRLARRVAGEAAAQGTGVVLACRELKDENPSLILPSYLSNRAKAEAVKAAYHAALAYHPACAAMVIYRDMEQQVLIATTDGTYSTDRRVYTRLTANTIASRGAESQLGDKEFMSSTGFEALVKADPASIGRQAACRAVTNLEAGACPSGVMPVVFAPSAGGTFLHEASGHPLEASAAAMGGTIYAGKIGQQICSEKVTIVDKGKIPMDWGTTMMDDEGVPCGDTLLVEKGILRGYMVDRLNGRRLNMRPTGNGRKQSYRYLPTSRMHETCMLPGNDRLDEVFAGIEHGLYIKGIGGGAANSTTGDFTISSARANLIRHGEICEPVRTAIVMGNSLRAMMDIDMVAGDLDFSYGNCGASSGNLPVGNGTPHIRVKEMKITGRS